MVTDSKGEHWLTPKEAATKLNLSVSRIYQAHIPSYAAGYWLFGFASKKYHPIDDLKAADWLSLHLKTRYYTTRLHVGCFYLPAFLEEIVREVEKNAG